MRWVATYRICQNLRYLRSMVFGGDDQLMPGRDLDLDRVNGAKGMGMEEVAERAGNPSTLCKKTVEKAIVYVEMA